MNNVIQSAWESYRKDVVPPDAGVNQLEQLKSAFFGGATILFFTILTRMTLGREPQPADFKFMDELQAEMLAFKEACKNGRVPLP